MKEDFTRTCGHYKKKSNLKNRLRCLIFTASPLWGEGNLNDSEEILNERRRSSKVRRNGFNNVLMIIIRTSNI